MNNLDRIVTSKDRLDWIKESGFTLSCEFVPFSQSRNAIDDNKIVKHTQLSINWRVTITHRRGTYIMDYMQGVGHLAFMGAIKAYPNTMYGLKRYKHACERGYMPTEGEFMVRDGAKLQDPTAEDIFYCLLSDAGAALVSFEEWASDYGYSTDSIKALKIYEECTKTGLYFLWTIGPEGLDKARELWQDF